MTIAENPAERYRVLQGIEARGKPAQQPQQTAAIGYGRMSKSNRTNLADQRTSVLGLITRVINVRAESTIKQALDKVLATIATEPRHSIVVKAESVKDTRAALEAQLKVDRDQLKAIGRERAELTRQQAQGVVSVGDYYTALNLLGDEAEDVRRRIGNIEGMLKNRARGRDLGHVAGDVEQLRAWCQVQKGRDVPNLDVDEIKTRLQFCFDALTIDPATNTLTVTWSSELALVTGQATTSVPLKARLRRFSASGTLP